MFYVGQKVVCIDDSEPEYFVPGAPDRLKKGLIYTIVQVYPRPSDAMILLSLAEVNPTHANNGWRQNRFRPLVEDKKTISFTEGAPKDSKQWDNRKQKVKA